MEQPKMTEQDIQFHLENHAFFQSDSDGNGKFYYHLDFSGVALPVSMGLN